jgi:hypothetical protein
LFGRDLKLSVSENHHKLHQMANPVVRVHAIAERLFVPACTRELSRQPFEWHKHIKCKERFIFEQCRWRSISTACVGMYVTAGRHAYMQQRISRQLLRKIMTFAGKMESAAGPTPAHHFETKAHDMHQLSSGAERHT